MSDVAAEKTLLKWRKDPVLFVRQALGAEPTWQQEELLRAVVREKRIAVRSGHGTGKDAAAAWIILWFLVTRPHAKGVATAPIYRQLNDILWSEVAKWIRQSPLRNEIEIEKDILFVKPHKRTWFVRGVTAGVKETPEEQAETLAGYHGDHILVIVDEASGVPDPVFRPLEGILTGKDNKVILIGNPTRDAGYFYEVFNGPHAPLWFKLHWNSEDSPLVTHEFVEFYRTKYGSDSDVYRVRVLGEFPRTAADVLIPRAKIYECQELWRSMNPEETRAQWPLVVGLDVARTGPDRSVLTFRYGIWIDEQAVVREADAARLCDWVVEQLEGRDEAVVYVDAVGMGGPVADMLRRLGKNVVDVNTGWKSSDSLQWRRLRDELWWNLRERVFNRAIALPPSEELIDELSSVRMKWVGNQIVIADKQAMRQTLGFSPDLADSLVLTEYDANTAMSRVWSLVAERRRRIKRAALGWKVV